MAEDEAAEGIAKEVEGEEDEEEAVVASAAATAGAGAEAEVEEARPLLLLRPCDHAAEALSRAVESRMVERGYLTRAARSNARENDTLWMELMHAVVVAHQGRHRQRAHQHHRQDHDLDHDPGSGSGSERYFAAAERELRGLDARLAGFEKATGTLWHDEQERRFAVKCVLAQIAHLRRAWDEAGRRWAEAAEYGAGAVSEWDGSNYNVQVARYSLAEARCSGGADARRVIDGPLLDTAAAVTRRRVNCMVGMGTYWLDFVHGRMAPRIEAIKGATKKPGCSN